MIRKISDKYHIETVLGMQSDHKVQPQMFRRIAIKNSLNGNEIPEDEPIFILRAKDRLALKRLEDYYLACEDDNCTTEHLSGIMNSIVKFREYARDNPDKMKQPGSTMPQDLKKIEEEVAAAKRRHY